MRWRRRVGIEPDRRMLTHTSNGFEDRASHQTRCASARVAISTETFGPRRAQARLAASVSFPIMPALFRFPLPKEQPLSLKDLISIHDLTPKEVRQIFTTTADLKAR